MVLNSTAPGESQLQNPLTPMAFFPPSVAYEMTLSSYVLVGAVTAMIWDVLNNLRGDYIILTQHRIQFPAIVYCISRLSNLAWLLMETIFYTAPLEHCARTLNVVSSLLAISIPSTSLLFFCRLRPLYRDNKWVLRFFFLSWLGVCGGSLVSVFGTSGENIGPTNYCTDGHIRRYVSFSGMSIVVYDTLVFVAISWRLTKMTLQEEGTFNDTIKAAIFGRNLPAFTRSLIKDGQMYYLMTIGTSIAATAVVYTDSIPLLYRGMVGSPNIMLMNVLACRVYRNTKLGLYSESSDFLFSDAQARNVHAASFQVDENPIPLGVVQNAGPLRLNLNCSRGESYWEPTLWKNGSRTAAVDPSRMA